MNMLIIQKKWTKRRSPCKEQPARAPTSTVKVFNVMSYKYCHRPFSASFEYAARARFPVREILAILIYYIGMC